MYNTNYNRRVASDVNGIHQNYINHTDDIDEENFGGSHIKRKGRERGKKGGAGYGENWSNVGYPALQKALAERYGHHLEGSGFMNDFWTGFQMPFKAIAPALPYLAPLIGLGHPYHPHHNLKGSGFMDDFWKGFQMPFKAFAPALPYLAKGLGHPHKEKRARKTKSKHMKGEGFFDDFKDTFEPYLPYVKKVFTGGKKGKKDSEKKGKRKAGNPNLSKRADIVKKVMKEHGLSMINASKYVKEHGLY